MVSSVGARFLWVVVIDLLQAVHYRRHHHLAACRAGICVPSTSAWTEGLRPYMVVVAGCELLCSTPLISI